MTTLSALDNFIPLNRTFHRLTHEAGAGDEVDFERLMGRRDEMHWPALLAAHRVILLSEAGSGKTAEIRYATTNLRDRGKVAFFIRIENIVQDLEDAFEIGTFEEFTDWLMSGEDGWIFLDSVDEARLRDPKDFERAIRKFGRRLQGKAQAAHVVITGRTSAWRPKTDLLLCRDAVPYTPAARSADVASHSDETESVETTTSAADETSDPFLIVSLDDLKGEQIDNFVRDKGVTDVKAFRDAVERKEAWSFTTRPLDLTELVEFWTTHGRIGTRLELMTSSIARRLEERDQNRSEARPISVEKIRLGARLVAAAATLTQDSSVRVPDGSENAKGIAIKDVLTDWNDTDCLTLLSRPIFDEGIYGTVRFHHRSVREYLTAEWLNSLIVDDASRKEIEGLFFRNQYGMEVIVPAMRPVLPWLAILDERILARVCRLAPEVLFEGGDPSQLPLDTRRTILRQACEQLAQPAHGRTLTEFAAVQRFAQADLTDDVIGLLREYGDDDDIAWFLLRMIAQGELVGAAAEAKRFALTSRSKYTRIAAFRALEETGSVADRAEVRTAFLAETGDLPRDWLAEMLPDLPRDQIGLNWLQQALGRAAPKAQFETDGLGKAISDYLAEVPLALLPGLMDGLVVLLNAPPVVERRFCEVSLRHGWLVQQVGEVAERLIGAKHAAALFTPTLSVLRKLPIVHEYRDSELKRVVNSLTALISLWPELNQALFWQDVAESRSERDHKRGERLIDAWQVGIFGRLWAFKLEDLDRICADIAARPLLDDKLVALTLAFSLYRQAGRPSTWRARLKRLAETTPELGVTLQSLLHPPAQGRQVWKKQDAAWKRQAARREAKALAHKLEWRTHLAANIEALRNPPKPDTITNAQYYLHQHLQVDDAHSNRWTSGSWRSLIAEFGQPIAEAFRDGAVAYWRGHRPQVLSSGKAVNSTPFSVILGLTGLSIEAAEDDCWPTHLTQADAENASRYALLELNGFPTWLPGLFQAFPDVVTRVVLAEIDDELSISVADADSHYVLNAVACSGQWLWDVLAPAILERLKKPLKNVTNLRRFLTIVQGSSLSDAAIAAVAAQKAKVSKDLIVAPIWFAVWVGVEPDVAVPALAARLAGMLTVANRTPFAMHFITALLGGRLSGRGARQTYRTVQHMKALYLIMHAYVRAKDDIQRAGKGVYSPGLRDDAQDARDALFAFIREAPGKDAYLALLDIARAHPEESSRPWMAFHAKAKATADADISAWLPSQVRDFHDALERTPANHRDLWYLAVSRLTDLRSDLEEGDSSVASILQSVEETEIRKFIGNWCRDRSGMRYSIPQEEELADAKRPDLRFHGIGFDGPVPAELKLADKWTGPHLFERLEIQLCGDYLRDKRSSRGIFLLVYQGLKQSWDLPNGGRAEGFAALVAALQLHWRALALQFPRVEDIRVIGIDLTKRGIDAKALAAARRAAKAAADASSGVVESRTSKARIER